MDTYLHFTTQEHRRTANEILFLAHWLAASHKPLSTVIDKNARVDVTEEGLTAQCHPNLSVQLSVAYNVFREHLPLKKCYEMLAFHRFSKH